MKNSNYTRFTTFTLGILFLFISVSGFSQARKLPDGSVIYEDGTRQLPNGTVIYKGGRTVDNNGTAVTLPDGTVVYPEGTRKYPRNKRRGDRNRDNRDWLPPGQAKKIYGGSAKDYAKGQQKKWKGNKKGKNRDKDYDYDRR